MQAALTDMHWLLPNPRSQAQPLRSAWTVFFDERSYKLATLVVESFVHLGKEDSDLVDQVAEALSEGRTEHP